MKFGTVTQFDPLDRSDLSKFKISKTQDGGGRNLEKQNIAIRNSPAAV